MMNLRRATWLVSALICLCCAAQQPADSGANPQDPFVKDRAVLAAAEAAHPGNTVEVAQALNNLVGDQLQQQVPPDQMESFAQRALTVAQNAAGKYSEVYVTALANMANVEVAYSRPADARPLAEQAMKLALDGKLGDDALINAAYGLGSVCDVLADFPCAIHADLLAAAATRKHADADHEWTLAGILSSLSDVQERTGDTAGAGASIMESLAAATHARPNAPEIAILESDVGAWYLRDQKFAEALPHLNKAIDEFNRNFGPGNVWIPMVQLNLGELYTRTGKFQLAWQNYEEALANSPATADELAREHGSFARSLTAGGDLERAIAQGLQSEQMGRDTFILQARTMSEREALAYYQNRPSGLHAPLSIVALHPELASAAVYQEMVRSRALVADEMARREKNLNATNDPDVTRLLNQLKAAQMALLRANSAPAGATGKAAIDAAQAQVDSIERELGQKSAAIRAEERVRLVGVDDLRQNLPANSALVSYVAYQKMPVATVDPARSDTPSYLAMILKPDSDRIAAVDLGDAKTINALVAKLRASADAEAHSGGLNAARNERAWRETGEALRKRIWDPLRPVLAGANVAIIVPDGMLNLIPFAGLPDGNGYLVERGVTIHMLSSERDLIPAAPQSAKAGMLAIGAPRFDTAQNVQMASTLRDTPISCDAFQKLRFQALPGAQQEVTAIRATWKRWNGSEKFVALLGADATRESFLSSATRSRVIHVATHAFVLDRSCGGNPLLHSGLVFAGANQSRTSAILTAQQIASLDLSGVDLAVLSACDTGGGELTDGEGVLGLERAFHIAGARSVIMTLWPVDDKITSRYMQTLYGQLLAHKAQPADAVWAADRTMLLARRSAGLSTHPWYWAGFVASGWK